MTAALLIRDARLDELDQVSLLLKAAYQQYEASIPPEAWRYYLEDIMDVRGRWQTAELIVAEEEGKLVGAVTLYLNASEALEQQWPKGWAGVRLLGVDPRYRGRGIGRALMDECIRRCRERHVKTIGLHTTKIMKVARQLYERMGFRRAREFDFHPAPAVTVMAYRLDL